MSFPGSTTRRSTATSTPTTIRLSTSEKKSASQRTGSLSGTSVRPIPKGQDGESTAAKVAETTSTTVFATSDTTAVSAGDTGVSASVSSSGAAAPAALKPLNKPVSTLEQLVGSVTAMGDSVKALLAQLTAKENKATSAAEESAPTTTIGDVVGGMDANLRILLGHSTDAQTTMAELSAQLSAGRKAADEHRTDVVARSDADRAQATECHAAVLAQFATDGKAGSERHTDLVTRSDADRAQATERHAALLAQFATDGKAGSERHTDLVARSDADRTQATKQHAALLARFDAEAKTGSQRHDTLISRSDADRKEATERHAALLGQLEAEGKAGSERNDTLISRSNADRKEAAERQAALLERLKALDTGDELKAAHQSARRWRCCAITAGLVTVVATPMMWILSSPRALFNQACQSAATVCRYGGNTFDG